MKVTNNKQIFHQKMMRNMKMKKYLNSSISICALFQFVPKFIKSDHISELSSLTSKKVTIALKFFFKNNYSLFCITILN